MPTRTKRLRTMDEITSDMEPLLDELFVRHQMQWGEVFGLIHSFIQVHYPDHQEEYKDSTKPTFYYGPKEGLKK